ncbi:MAG: hypothetical protein JO107_05655 [Hyphomicrobiales bacterium]|nr:hypothetical protein [Hyphomicrobiales bacterium]
MEYSSAVPRHGSAAKYQGVRRGPSESIQRKIVKDDGKFYTAEELMNKLTGDYEDKNILHEVLNIHADRERLIGNKTLPEALELARSHLAERYQHPPPEKKQRAMASDLSVPARPVNSGYSRATDNPMGASTTNAMVAAAETKQNRSMLESAFIFDSKMADIQVPVQKDAKGPSGKSKAKGRAKPKKKKTSRGMQALQVSRNHILADSVIYNIFNESLGALAQLMRDEKMTLLQLRWRSLPVAKFLEALGAGADALTTFRSAVDNRANGRGYKMQLIWVQALASLGRNNLRFGDAPTNTRILNGFDPDLQGGCWTAKTTAIYHSVHGLAQAGLIARDTAFNATATSKLDGGDQKGSILTSSTVTELSGGGNRAPFYDSEVFGEEAKDTAAFRRSASMPPRLLSEQLARGRRTLARRTTPETNNNATAAADQKGDAGPQGESKNRRRKRKRD